ncbi:MAG TPA: ATP-binding cassette domain-containing protein [Candidatus Paceibacterota bacterium]|jgi:cell division transport system ATP-binding protein|nr:ATP-binding cassette domain-containing protein [Candidatus Paceibacterota bacterium]HOQ15323.1 ATP-binding cassette domain-containing protein [Candidatus Paceibacterota bacterium]HPQ23188.1 ATP-binding cassette domain-containing protein [Candidatus Paceibacterota bacterium]HRR45695.1 ATP-binding cassette domain-containing protein [Candidatus Paceibacterota bacterium]
MSLVYFKNVSKSYHGNLILDNISFEIENGEFVSLVGRSGVGKTTILKLLIREEKPTKGRIFFEDKDINKLKPREVVILRRKIGMIFQDFKLLENKNSFENIAFAMEICGCSDKEIRQDVPELLKLVGLEDKAGNFPYQLSAGEKQRLVIARVLAQRPELILADEPTGNLDPINAWEIIKLLTKINELGTAIILATHDKEIVNSLNKRVISLEHGKIVRDEQEGRYLI